MKKTSGRTGRRVFVAVEDLLCADGGRWDSGVSAASYESHIRGQNAEVATVGRIGWVALFAASPSTSDGCQEEVASSAPRRAKGEVMSPRTSCRLLKNKSSAAGLCRGG